MNSASVRRTVVVKDATCVFRVQVDAGHVPDRHLLGLAGLILPADRVAANQIDELAVADIAVPHHEHLSRPLGQRRQLVLARGATQKLDHDDLRVVKDLLGLAGRDGETEVVVDQRLTRIRVERDSAADALTVGQDKRRAFGCQHGPAAGDDRDDNGR